MAHFEWSEDLNTNIKVIDEQHKRIVIYINELDDAKATHDSTKVGDIITELVDYTVSHFAFEESLLEQAGYPFVVPHKKVHELFVRRIAEFTERHKAGEDVTVPLHTMLVKWLTNHIRTEDADYVDIVSRNIGAISKEGGWLSSALKRFFK